MDDLQRYQALLFRIDDNLRGDPPAREAYVLAMARAARAVGLDIDPDALRRAATEVYAEQVQSRTEVS